MNNFVSYDQCINQTILTRYYKKYLVLLTHLRIRANTWLVHDLTNLANGCHLNQIGVLVVEHVVLWVVRDQLLGVLVLGGQTGVDELYQLTGVLLLGVEEVDAGWKVMFNFVFVYILGSILMLLRYYYLSEKVIIFTCFYYLLLIWKSRCRLKGDAGNFLYFRVYQTFL